MMQHILVTGACGGIGSAVVEKLLAQGFGIWAVDRDEERLNSMYGNNGKVRYYKCEFESEDATKSLMSTIKDTTGAIRGLVHCAGFDKLSPLFLNKRADVEALFNIHVYAAMDLCKYLAKKDYAEQGCSVVLISSLSAHEGAKGHTAYAAAKGAIEGFLPSAACELMDKKIRINEVVLGIVKTFMSMGYIEKMDEEQEKLMKESYPLGIGNTCDVSGMICYLLSDEVRWITGQKFVLDGGHSVRKV